LEIPRHRFAALGASPISQVNRRGKSVTLGGEKLKGTRLVGILDNPQLGVNLGEGNLAGQSGPALVADQALDARFLEDRLAKPHFVEVHAFVDFFHPQTPVGLLTFAPA
jgi:hypothetical protein